MNKLIYNRTMKCTLPKSINQCPYLIPEISECNNPSNLCSFQEEELEISKAYPSKKEKWYERYYKNNGKQNDTF